MPFENGIFGGRGGIRTHGTLRYTAFRVRLVMTTSILFHGYSVAGFIQLALTKIHDYNTTVKDVLFRACYFGRRDRRHARGGEGISGLLREINIKSDLPTVDNAIRRITYNIKTASALGVSAIKIIHGYGSSGKGGAIRTEARKYLDRQMSRSSIKYYIKGEDFSIFDEATRNAFAVCDALRRDSDIERHNNGITIVIL